MSDLSPFAKQIHDSVLETMRATRMVIPGHPFCGFVDPECGVPWMSVAIPVAALESLERARTAVDLLRAAFLKNSRILRVEFFDELWPGVAVLLEEIGLKREEPQPLMVCSRDGFVDPGETPIDIQKLKRGVSLNTLVSFVNAQRSAYSFSGGAVGAGEEAVSILNDIERGSLTAVLAYDNGEVIGTAVAVGSGALREIAGVCTIPAMRRRGVARALSAAVVSLHFAAGGTLAWLTAGSGSAERVYRRLGFKRVGVSQINLSDPPPFDH